MWDTVCCKTTGKRVQSSRAEFSDITDESQLRGKSGVLCFSFLFFVTFWQRRMPKPPPSLRECGCVYCCIQVMWENLLEHFSSDRAFKLKVWIVFSFSGLTHLVSETPLHQSQTKHKQVCPALLFHAAKLQQRATHNAGNYTSTLQKKQQFSHIRSLDCPIRTTSSVCSHGASRECYKCQLMQTCCWITTLPRI